MPVVEPVVLQLWRNGKFLFLKGKWKLVAFKGRLTGTYSREIDTDRISYVSPKRIKYSSLREFDQHDFKGHVIGGDWDGLEKRFEDLDIYIALKQVCKEGKDWSETVFYRRVLDALNRGDILWGCREKGDFDRRCKYLEDLFREIQVEEYKSQRELVVSRRSHDPLSRLETEISVSIGRQGDLLFSDGAHRLAVAKLLGIETIPITIAVRHPGWMRFRSELMQYAAQLDGRACPPITHPDLYDVPVSHACDHSFAIIKEYLTIDNGRLVDIGAKLGYFCHRFEDEGFKCFAVEASPRHLYFLRMLRRAENREFKIIAKSVLEWREIRNMKIDVVLALNVFHHFFKTKTAYDSLVDLLNNLQMRELFFESPLPGERAIEGAYASLDPDELVEFLIKNSELESAELIGLATNGSPIYRLS